MTRLQVEAADFHEAAVTMRRDVAESVRICLDGLSLPSAMVGDDPAGESWSAAYDQSARTVLRATATLSNAAARMSVLFAHSGHNYARAEAASTSGRPADAATFAELLRAPTAVTAPTAPRSGGAGNGTPSGWWLIEHSLGFVWPGGHQDRLRTAAAEWRLAAGGVEQTAMTPVLAAVAFARDRLPEADDVATVCRGLHEQLDALGRAHRSLADACESCADHLDECHDAVREQLADLLRDSAIVQGTGAVLAICTFGGSEVAAQIAQAGRIAVTAAKVTTLIERLIAAGRRIATVLERVHHIAQEIERAASKIANLQLVSADIAQARATSPVTASASTDQRSQAAAAGRLARGPRIKRPLNAAERKHILDGDSPTSGGHRWPGNPGKSTFPREWSDEQIISSIEDVVRSDDTRWRIDTGNGGSYTRLGKPAVWRSWEFRDGIRIRVVWEPATGHIRSAFPDPTTPANGGIVP